MLTLKYEDQQYRYCCYNQKCKISLEGVNHSLNQVSFLCLKICLHYLSNVFYSSKQLQFIPSPQSRIQCKNFPFTTSQILKHNAILFLLINSKWYWDCVLLKINRVFFHFFINIQKVNYIKLYNMSDYIMNFKQLSRKSKYFRNTFILTTSNNPLIRI